jgi:hypothetical protein
MGRLHRHFSPPAMLKAVKLDASKHVIPKGARTKPTWWLVNVGKRSTGTSKIRRFFKTEKKAKQFIADTIAAAAERGRSAFAIPQALAVEAMELDKQLACYGVTLTQAVRFYLRHAATTASQTVEQLLPRYLLTKVNPEYQRDQKFSLRVFQQEFGKAPINTIQAPAIEKWLKINSELVSVFSQVPQSIDLPLMS